MMADHDPEQTLKYYYLMAIMRGLENTKLLSKIVLVFNFNMTLPDFKFIGEKMAFPRKGTRSISHKEVMYHWRFGRSCSKGFASVLVEKVKAKGQVLSVQFPTDINDLYLDFSEPLDVIRNKNYRSVKPGMISSFIEQALNLGWKCDDSDKTLELIADQNDKLKLIISKTAT